MTTAAIQRQYNEVIAANYDLDPQSVNARTLACALAHLKQCCDLSIAAPPLKTLDVGMGTGQFLARLRQGSERAIEPFGLDLSERMVEIAMARIPDLTAAIDDAVHVDRNFATESFDLICTHFVTGFVPMEHLAPRIWDKLKPGGYWSFVGATSQAYPQLQSKTDSRLLRMIIGGRRFDPADTITPRDCGAVVDCFDRHAFQTALAETFEPELVFNTFDEFMEFAYRGGWLTPFIEELGLQNAGRPLRAFLNALVFPIRDRHRIAICLARKPLE